jgi:hypothetical protein
MVGVMNLSFSMIEMSGSVGSEPEHHARAYRRSLFEQLPALKEFIS